MPLDEISAYCFRSESPPVCGQSHPPVLRVKITHLFEVNCCPDCFGRRGPKGSDLGIVTFIFCLSPSAWFCLPNTKGAISDRPSPSPVAPRPHRGSWSSSASKTAPTAPSQGRLCAAQTSPSLPQPIRFNSPLSTRPAWA